MIIRLLRQLLTFSSAIIFCQGIALSQGRTVSLTYRTDGNLYPGTERNLQVYIPQQYSGTQACLYIGLDGIMCNAPAVFDRLIAEGKMPVTIGIFVQPGLIRGKDGQVVRYNRSNEFDFTDGRFAEFLDSEIIPFVENSTGVRISKDPDKRAIFGLSSGGIAAFNAAWMRPDLFRRVFSGVGTFVSMRGGNDLQMFVRKSEPKPLRIFLQDGSNDVWNATFGHWYEANRMLATALDFAGYDAGYDWSDGYHSVKRSAEIFEQVMVWLWRDYPEPVRAGITQNDFLNKYLYQDQEKTPFEDLSVCGKDQWIKEKDIDASAAEKYGNRYAATYPDGSFMALETDLSHDSQEGNCLWQAVISNGQPAYQQRFYWLHSYGNQTGAKGPMAFDSKGNLFILTDTGIQVCDQNGRVRFILEIPDEVKTALLKERKLGLRQLNIKIAEEKILLSDGQTFTYSRKFNIMPPIKGQTPKSQGQG